MRIKVFAYNDKKAEQVLARAEDTYKRLTQILGKGGLMFKDCLIFFWQNREDFVKESKRLTKGTVSEWAGAFADYQFSRREVAIFAYETANMFTDIFPHELTHQVLAQGLCFTGIPHIPLWLNEGLAQYMEENKGQRHLIVSSALKANSLFNLKDLTQAYSYPKENVSLFYAQSLSLVEYLLENYPGDKFYSLARRLVQENAPMEKALKGAYWPEINSLKDLEEKWLAWLKKTDYFQKTGKASKEDTV